MGREESRENKDYYALDFPWLVRRLRKYIYVIVLCSCIVGCMAFVALDWVMQDSYSVSVQLNVVARDNSASKQAATAFNTAVTRCINVLNSDLMESLISDSLKDTGISGTLNVARVGTTNMITLSATGSSAKGAFRFLQAALEAYPELSDYYESGYMLQQLTSLSADNIVCTEANPLSYSALAALFVLATGIAVTLLSAVITDRIHNRAQAEALLDISVSGELSYVKKQKGQKALLITDELTDALYQEDIDRLTTRIQEEMHQGHYHNLLVTSIRENEGKSTVAVNIALNLAKRGKKVLLVDSDMRRPAIHRIFEIRVPKNGSFSDYLNGSCTMEDAIYKMDKTENLSLIMQKEEIANPDSLLEESSISRLIAEAGERFDYILFDTPPFGVVRDSELVARVVETAVVVFRQDEIRAVAINDTVDLLERAGTHVISGVLNMVKGSKYSRNRKGGYGYYYGYYGSHGKRDS